MTEQEIKNLKDRITDHISDIEFDYDELESEKEIEFELDNGNIYFEGKISCCSCVNKCGCDIFNFDIYGQISANCLSETETIIPYYETDFEYEFITDEYSYYGVSQSDFL